jgi:hypothetical protein
MRPDAATTVHAFQSLHNFRDLGGLAAERGGRTRHGVLFRSDSFHTAPAADIDYLLNRIGLASIIDLRSEAELAADRTNPLISATIRYQHLPIAGGPGGAIEAAPTGLRLATRYMEYLDQHAPSVVGAVRAIADANGEPTVVHCRAGKDRTGVVVAMVLATLGVKAEDIAADYALTSAGMRKIMADLAASAHYSAKMKRLPAEMYSSEAPTMTAFLAMVDDRHGGAARWLVDNGLPSAALRTLEDNLIYRTLVPDPRRKHP